MKTLVAYYSKTGTTKKVAQAIVSKLSCDIDEITFNDQTKAISHTKEPSDYDKVILLAPVWAFSLAEPMKQYVAKHKANIKQYDLIVTCGMFGLRGCVKNCVSSFGKPPDKALIFKAKNVNSGNYDISSVL